MPFFFVILPSSLHDVPITDAAPPVETFRSRDEPSPPQLTMTDAITKTCQMMLETKEYGFDKVREEQWALGKRVRALLEGRGFRPVAAPGFQAPGVVVSYTDDDLIHTGKAFIAQGLQTAAGVPLRCDEPADYKTFRIGLFGLDKLHNIDQTVGNLERALNAIQN